MRGRLLEFPAHPGRGIRDPALGPRRKSGAMGRRRPTEGKGLAGPKKLCQMPKMSRKREGVRVLDSCGFARFIVCVCAS